MKMQRQWIWRNTWSHHNHLMISTASVSITALARLSPCLRDLAFPWGIISSMHANHHTILGHFYSSIFPNTIFCTIPLLTRHTICANLRCHTFSICLFYFVTANPIWLFSLNYMGCSMSSDLRKRMDLSSSPSTIQSFWNSTELLLSNMCDSGNRRSVILGP